MSNRSNGVLSVYLGPLKHEWQNYCRSHGVSPSDATKQVIRMLIGREVPGEIQIKEDISVGSEPKKRIEIRLTAWEYQAASDSAERSGFSVNSWIVALLRTRLTETPQLGQFELEQLAASNSRLLAIGRNLNQITRALNARPTEMANFRPEIIVALSDAIQSHTADVAALIQSNVQRWSR
ncbi:hypothetical protein R75465_07319 [Paraburkholderia aspalathi]|nr:hypothetical protein R75465_07319 [Paraburkholderia aspalathi]